ncbi:GAF and ANTAR domain-containing protein [Catellatospora tritici]|uniref:GAF and ANTAR domain-containing protein n=1 Tax=Catellatospora tritici TaxID=2851566 RepID=UPI0027E2139F|nr:GAF and ANTAR domain-containing protein [Catellatospora tritici]
MAAGLDRFRQVEALIAAEPHADDHTAHEADGLRQLCGAAVRALSACGVGLTVVASDGARAVTAASDPAAERFEELQLTLGEGPCIDAYTARHPVMIPDLDEAMARWPAYSPAVHAGGVRAVFAFPLQIGAARLGMLDVFRPVPGMLTTDEVTLALTFAEVTVTTLLDRQHDADRADTWLHNVLGSRSELFQAQGMVMAQLATTLTDAMARIRAYAHANDQRLSEVATGIIARRIVFDRHP